MLIEKYSWLILSLLVAALFALVNTFDKSVLSRTVRSPIVITCIVGLISIIPTTLIFITFIFYQVPIPSVTVILVSVSLGMLFTFFTYMYFKALNSVAVDVVVGTLQLSVICSVVWGYFIFDESFGGLTYVGIGIVVFFLFVLSVYRGLSRKTKAEFFPVEILYAVLAAVLLSIGLAIQKYLTKMDISPWVIFFYSRMGNLLTILILFLVIPNLLKLTFGFVQKYKLKLSYVVLVEMIYFSTIILRLFAVSSGFLTTVATFVTAQPLFVTIYTFIQERFGRVDKQYHQQSFAIRFILVLMIVLGGLFIAWDYHIQNINTVSSGLLAHEASFPSHVPFFCYVLSYIL